VIEDRRIEARRPPVVEESRPNPDAPQWGGANLTASGRALADPVAEAAHVVEQKVRDESVFQPPSVPINTWCLNRGGEVLGCKKNTRSACADRASAPSLRGVPDRGYVLVALNAPQAVNLMVTVEVWLPCVTTTVSVPPSNRGVAVQVAL
jgi:hypothetical protein